MLRCEFARGTSAPGVRSEVQGYADTVFTSAGTRSSHSSLLFFAAFLAPTTCTENATPDVSGESAGHPHRCVWMRLCSDSGFRSARRAVWVSPMPPPAPSPSHVPRWWREILANQNAQAGVSSSRLAPGDLVADIARAALGWLCSASVPARPPRRCGPRSVLTRSF